MSNDLLSIPPVGWDERREPREDDRQEAERSRLCVTCEGSGLVDATDTLAQVARGSDRDCPDCGGSGRARVSWQAAERARDARMARRVCLEAAKIIGDRAGDVIHPVLAAQLAMQIEVVLVGELIARRGR